LRSSLAVIFTTKRIVVLHEAAARGGTESMSAMRSSPNSRDQDQEPCYDPAPFTWWGGNLSAMKDDQAEWLPSKGI
jgi:hypothetical protein